MTTTWDDTFETKPASSDAANTGATSIREVKTAVSEREELEHEFKLNKRPFHKAGKCAVMHSGDTESFTGISASEGCIGYDTETGKFMRHNGSEWVEIELSHGALVNLYKDKDWEDDEEDEEDEAAILDPHTQYLLLTDRAGGQTLVQNLDVAVGKTIDGRDLDVDGEMNDNISAPSGFGAWSSVSVTVGSSTITPSSYDYEYDKFITLSVRYANWIALNGEIKSERPGDPYWHRVESNGLFNTTLHVLTFFVPKGFKWRGTFDKTGTGTVTITVQKMRVFY